MQCKTKLFCFCNPFQAGGFQAGRQTLDMSAEHCIVTYFARPHVPFSWASTRQDGVEGGSVGTGAESLSTIFHVFLFLCVHMHGQASKMCPDLLGGKLLSEPSHTDACRQKREKQVGLTLPKTLPQVLWWSCLCVEVCIFMRRGC